MVDEQWLSSAQVAHHLGVKLQTVYAYVSRGVLHPVRREGRRGSWFTAAEISGLTAAAGSFPVRRRRAPGLADDIRTAITWLDDDHFAYRGKDVIELATTHTFEDVCQLLWEHPARFVATPTVVAEVGEPYDRLLMAVTRAGAADPGRSDLSSAAVATAGARCIAAGISSLGGTLGPPGTGQVATAVAGLLSGRTRRRGSRLVRLVDTALMLTADHDLALSTTAVRVAASVRADPYAAITAGLAAARSPAHGTASRAARQLLLDAVDAPGLVLNEVLAGVRQPHGFGHRVLNEADRRADLLLPWVLERAPARMRDGWALVIDGLWERRGLPPNVDLALAALCVVEGLRPDGGEIIFALARMAGWTAHAMEEYAADPLRFRLRGVYVGPR